MGFRGKQEFDKKRLLVANKETFSVVGYDHRKHVFELIRQGIEDKENNEIRFVSFLDDSQPYYILLLVANKETGKTSLQIMEIKRDEDVNNRS